MNRALSHIRVAVRWDQVKYIAASDRIHQLCYCLIAMMAAMMAAMMMNGPNMSTVSAKCSA